MKNDIAHTFNEVLQEGNFNSSLITHNNTNAVKIEHCEVSAELGLQHIQEFLDEQIEQDSDWFFDNSIENISEFSTSVFPDFTLIY